MDRKRFVAVALFLAAPLTPSARQAAPRAAAARPTAAAAPTPAPPERATPFHVGETLTYDVSWASYLTAGTVVATVQAKKASYNSSAYYVVAEARPGALVSAVYPVYYKMDTLIDVFTLLPQRGSVYSEEKTRHRYRATTFDRPHRKASFEYHSTGVAKDTFSVQPDVQDALSVLYALRARPLQAGAHISMPVSDSGTNYRVQFDVGPPERLTTPIGTMSAWKLQAAIYDAENKRIGRDSAIWLSADQRQLPVRLQADLPLGAFVLALRDAK
ncbi:MAG: DUF3108 domain-containing protein [Acidobacteriota bacterium]